MSKKIWVIDDDDGILEGFQAMLDRPEYEVRISSNGDILKKITEKNKPDLIILDVLLSGVDGRDICQKLKQDTFTKDIQIIMTSAALDVQKSVSEVHADGFIAKPFEMDELESMIERYLNR